MFETIRRVTLRDIPTHKLSKTHCALLVQAIQKSGSTLRDFIHSDGFSGFFQQHYFVYGRTSEPCKHCGAPIKQIKQRQ